MIRVSNFEDTDIQAVAWIIFLWVVNVSLLIFGIIYGNRVYQSYSEMKTHMETNAGLKDKVDLIYGNRQLTQDQIDNYNEVLGKLIPDSENYFAVITSLEQIAQQTGFKLLRYNINLASSTNEKMSLLVEGGGDIDAFMKFIKYYQYAGGRLITIERLEFSPRGVQNIRLTLNFYHTKASYPKGVNKALTTQDTDFMKDVMTKSTQTIK